MQIYEVRIRSLRVVKALLIDNILDLLQPGSRLDVVHIIMAVRLTFCWELRLVCSFIGYRRDAANKKAVVELPSLRVSTSIGVPPYYVSSCRYGARGVADVVN